MIKKTLFLIFCIVLFQHGALASQSTADADKTENPESAPTVNLLQNEQDSDSVNIEVREMTLKEILIQRLREARSRGENPNVSEEEIRNLTEKQLEILLGRNKEAKEGFFDNSKFIQPDPQNPKIYKTSEEKAEEINEWAGKSILDIASEHKVSVGLATFLATSGLVGVSVLKRGQNKQFDKDVDDLMYGDGAQQYWIQEALKELHANEIKRDDAPKHYAFVDKVISKIENSEGYYKPEELKNITYVIADNNLFNAQNTIANAMVINKGAVNRCLSTENGEDMMIALIAHESEHATGKHLETLARQTKLGNNSKETTATLARDKEWRADAASFQIVTEVANNPGGQLAMLFQPEFSDPPMSKDEMASDDHPLTTYRQGQAIKRLQKYSNGTVQIKMFGENMQVMVDGKEQYFGEPVRGSFVAGQYAKEAHKES